MFLRLLASLIRDSIVGVSNYKYTVQSIENVPTNSKVTCELVGTGDTIKLYLDDIINHKLQFFRSKDVLLLSNLFTKKNMYSTKKNNIERKYYASLTVAFTILLILSNLGALKLVDFFGYALDGGTILFPLLYILSDVLTEVYGFSASRRVIWTAFFYNCLCSSFIYILILLPSSPYWDGQQAFYDIFSISPRIFIASISSYLIGEFLNTTIIAYLKIKFIGKYFAVRATISTLIGSLLESIVFGYIAFYGTIPADELLKMIMLLATIKVIYEILLMPFTIKIVSFLKNKEGVDVFEKPSLKGIIPGLI